MRDKNGRFLKKTPHIEISVPSITTIIKYIIVIFIFSPWIYTILKFDVFTSLESSLNSIFGPKVINECQNQKTPY